MKIGDFKEAHSEADRRAESARILKKYPERCPIICEIANGCDYTLEKHKYLVPRELNVAQFVYVIRKRIQIKADEAIFIFANNILPASAQLVGSLYDEQKDPDGFLYIVLNKESTFGN